MKTTLFFTVFVKAVLSYGVLENPNLFEGDLILTPAQREAINHAISSNSFAAVISNPWPSTTIAWSASKEIFSSTKAMKAINAAIAEYHAKTCLKFVRRTTEKAYFYFYAGDGCNSRVGYHGGVNKISLESQCQHTGTVLHEMFHSLGFYHEQCRPDRDQYVKIIWKNIPVGARNNFQKYTRESIDSMGIPYDYMSISHYRKDLYGAGRITIETLDKKYQNLIGTLRHLSKSDVKQLALMYRCDGTRTLPPTLTPPTPRPPVCEDMNGEDYCKPLLPYCKRDSSIGQVLKRQCYKSCGYCDKTVPITTIKKTNPPTIAPTARRKSTIVPSGCGDNYGYCSGYIQRCLYSHWRSWALKNCKKSCNLC